MTVVNETEALEQYDVMRDEIYGTFTVAGINFEASRILKEVDPIAYKVYFTDWCDEENIETE